MHLRHLTLLAAAEAVVAQVPTLAEVLAAQSETLSSLTTWLESQELVYNLLAGAEDVTLLAPSNDALQALNNSPLANELLSDPNYLTAFLSYHVLNGTFFASNLTSSPQLAIPTLLDLAHYDNVTGAQKIISKSSDGGVSFLSGGGSVSKVQAAVCHTTNTLLFHDTPTNTCYTRTSTTLAAQST